MNIAFHTVFESKTREHYTPANGPAAKIATKPVAPKSKEQEAEEKKEKEKTEKEKKEKEEKEKAAAAERQKKAAEERKQNELNGIWVPQDGKSAVNDLGDVSFAGQGNDNKQTTLDKHFFHSKYYVQLAVNTMMGTATKRADDKEICMKLALGIMPLLSKVGFPVVTVQHYFLGLLLTRIPVEIENKRIYLPAMEHDG